MNLFMGGARGRASGRTAERRDGRGGRVWGINAKLAIHTKSAGFK